ncbi:MAG: DUF1573 domain-containing protein [Desulfuromonas sp.]|nr:DUF1573 domain-containing protein [Desulfuromonas sp.]
MRYLSLLLALIVCCVSSVLAAPQLVVDHSEVDWGEICSGEKKEHRFVLTNSGDEPLRIIKVRSSCGCTTAIPRDTLVEPGGSTELTVRFNSKNFRGNVVKKVVIVSNDPRQSKKTLSLKSQVKPELTLAPSRLQLGRIPGGKQLHKSLTLHNPSDHVVDIMALRCTSAALRVVEVPSRLLAGESVSLDLTISTPDKSGARINGYILIESQGNARMQLRIPVMGLVK